MLLAGERVWCATWRWLRGHTQTHETWGLMRGERSGSWKVGVAGAPRVAPLPHLPQVQTRSSDEPMTTFVVCNECGNRWKVGGRTQATPVPLSEAGVSTVRGLCGVSCGAALPSQPPGSFATSGGAPSPVGGHGGHMVGPRTPLLAVLLSPRADVPAAVVPGQRWPPPSSSPAQTPPLWRRPCACPPPPEGRVPCPALLLQCTLPPSPKVLNVSFLPLCFPWPLVVVGHAQAGALNWVVPPPPNHWGQLSFLRSGDTWVGPQWSSAGGRSLRQLT